MPFQLQKTTEAVPGKGTAGGGGGRRQVKGKPRKASYFEGQTVDSLIYEMET